MKLIDKSATIAEIEKLKDYADEHWDNEEVKGVNKFLDRLEPIINTLEVKEVDLTEEINSYIESSLTGTNPIYTKGAVSHLIDRTAKHFFELGLKASCSVDLTPDLDTLFEEKGIDPYSKEAKSFKEAICKAIEIYFVKAQKGKGV